jgi:dihydroxyacid dehydratase/phosphogluconate dehydratase
VGVNLTLDDFDRLSRETPFITNVKPSGEKLMEDFYYGGGLPPVMKELIAAAARRRADGQRAHDRRKPGRHRDRFARSGAPLDDPLYPEGGTVILYGNLAPNGAVIKQTAASTASVETSRQGGGL